MLMDELFDSMYSIDAIYEPGAHRTAAPALLSCSRRVVSLHTRCHATARHSAHALAPDSKARGTVGSRALRSNRPPHSADCCRRAAAAARATGHSRTPRGTVRSRRVARPEAG